MDREAIPVFQEVPNLAITTSATTRTSQVVPPPPGFPALLPPSVYTSTATKFHAAPVPFEDPNYQNHDDLAFLLRNLIIQVDMSAQLRAVVVHLQEVISARPGLCQDPILLALVRECLRPQPEESLSRLIFELQAKIERG